MSVRMTLPSESFYRVLALDGGGAKGFYTLGVLKEIEMMLGSRLHEHFNLIFGTSTGAIIAALLALGHSVDEIHELYKTHVPTIMGRWFKRTRTIALTQLARQVFAEKSWADVKTGLGIVSARWVTEIPMIFKSRPEQSHERAAPFVPGFGGAYCRRRSGFMLGLPIFSSHDRHNTRGRLCRSH